MTELLIHRRVANTLFDLLGTKENDMTAALGWILARSPVFAKRFLERTIPSSGCTGLDSVSLQETSDHLGTTDLELHGVGYHIIIEAKQGWDLPTETQLRLYAARLVKSRTDVKVLLVLAGCNAEYALRRLPSRMDTIPISFLAWKELYDILGQLVPSALREKHSVRDAKEYFSRFMSMQKESSNLVYVVSLGSGIPSWSSLSWIDIIRKRARYFHPLAGTWPKEAPNYLGFRYGGKLQSIHHVDSCSVLEDLHEGIPEIKSGNYGPNLFYKLGPAIIPTHDVKTGSIYPSGRVWAAFDLLLTCKTVSEARDRTKKRLETHP